MPSRTATIASSVGLHARPAALLVKAITDSGLEVTITRADGKAAEGRSLLMVMALGVKCGEQVTLSAEGEGADKTLDQLTKLVESDLEN